jgi:flagellar hook-associated protein 2
MKSIFTLAFLLISSALLFSQISVPGISSSDGRIDTERVIGELMEVERLPLNRMEDSVERYETERRVWQDLGTSLEELRESARFLFGFQTPFNDRIASSSDESVLTATAVRSAEEQTAEIEVLSVATADRFHSEPLPLDYRVPAGRYVFRVGEERIAFTFSGGRLAAFAEEINDRGAGILRARVVRSTRDREVLSLESQITGTENSLVFEDASLDFALSAGIVETVSDSRRELSASPDLLQPWTRPVSAERVSIQDDIIVVEPGGEVALPVAPALSISPTIVLEGEIRLTDAEESWSPSPPPPGPDVSPGEGVTLEDVTIQNAPSRAPLAEVEPEGPPPVVRDDQLLFAQEGSNVVPLPEISESEEFVPLRLSLSDYVDSIRSLNIRNRNTYRTLELRNLEIYDTAARGDTRPVNAMDTAADAELLIDGVRVTRDSNTIEDAIPGVTLTLNNPGRLPVTLSVEPDREGAKEAVIGFVGQYNQIVRDINILTRNNESLINEVGYFTDEEREVARERLGMFQGESTLNQLRQSLQSIMMNPYETTAGRQLSLLAQAGISTNAAGANTGGYTASRLRGYLEISEQDLDQALASNFRAMKELFGWDTDGDQVVDSGAAFEIERYVAPYVQIGGIVASRTQGIDSRIARTENDMDRMNDRLDRREQQLRTEFGQMQSAIDSMDESTRALDNLNRQQGN